MTGVYGRRTGSHRPLGNETVSRADVSERPLGVEASGRAKRSFLVLWLISSVLSRRSEWKPKLAKTGLSEAADLLLRMYQA